MKAIHFPEVNCAPGSESDEYTALPAYVGQVGVRETDIGVITVFELSEEEILKLASGAKLIHKTLTFGQPLQPFDMAVDVVEGVEVDPERKLFTLAEMIEFANYCIPRHKKNSDGVNDGDVRNYLTELLNVPSFHGE